MRRYSAKSHLRGSLEGVAVLCVALGITKFVTGDLHDLFFLVPMFVVFLVASRLVKVDKAFKDK